MACKNVLLIFLFQTVAVLAADEVPIFSRSSYFGTLNNRQLKGHVVKRFDSSSLLSFGQQCMRNEWCTSTNYKMSSKKEGKGTCELNKHDISLVSENTNFHERQGVTFSMLLKGCLITSCFNGGSCLPDKEKQTFSCSCKVPWTGDKCEIYKTDCLQDWILYGNSCYHVISTPAPKWSDARETCQNLGGDVPIIRSEAENKFTLDLIIKEQTVPSRGAWLGLHRGADNKFYWVDGTPLEGQYSAWGSGEPNYLQDKCAHIHIAKVKAGKWNDLPCSLPKSNVDQYHAPVALCPKNSI